MDKKNKKGLSKEEILSKYSALALPLSVLRNKPLTIYEALILHLKDNHNINYHNIAVLLERDERDVRKVYYRAKDKTKKSK